MRPTKVHSWPKTALAAKRLPAAIPGLADGGMDYKNESPAGGLAPTANACRQSSPHPACGHLLPARGEDENHHTLPAYAERENPPAPIPRCHLTNPLHLHWIGGMPAVPMNLIASDAYTFDTLATPVVCCDAEVRVLGGNLAFARWLRVSQRRLVDRGAFGR